MKPLRAFAVAASLLLAASGCSDIFGSGGGEVGEVSFRFSGAESGEYAARGVRNENDWGSRTFAAGLRHEGFIQVTGYRRAGAGGGDVFSLFGQAAAPGAYAFSEEVEQGAVYAELAFGASLNGNVSRAIYVLTEGMLVVEPSGDERIRGRFSGTARLLGGTTVIQVTDGSFDVPDNMPQPVDRGG